MEDLPTFIDTPAFGTSAALSEPPDPTYDDGYTGGVVWPSQQANWFLHNLTGNGLLEQDAITSVMQELLSILSDQSISPDGGVHNQVLAAINDIVATPSRLGSGTPSAANMLVGSGVWTNVINELVVSILGAALTTISGDAAITGKLSVAKPTIVQFSNSDGWAGGAITYGQLFTFLNGITGSSNPVAYAARGVMWVDGSSQYGIISAAYRNSPTTYQIFLTTLGGSVTFITVTSGDGTSIDHSGSINLW